MLTLFAILGILLLGLGFTLAIISDKISKGLIAGFVFLGGMLAFGYGVIEMGQHRGVIAVYEGTAHVDTLANGKLVIVLDSALDHTH